MTTDISQLIGALLVIAVSFGLPILSAIVYLISVLIKLNKFLTTLEVNQNHQGEHLEEHGQRLNHHDDLLSQHTTEIKLLAQRRAP